MTGIELYSTVAANNNSAVPNGFPEGMAPSGVNDAARQMMAAIRTWYESAEWINLGDAPTYIGATQFSLVGDKTATYQVGRRIKAIGTTPFTIYGTISVSAYASVTTVTVVWDSGSLNSTLSAVSVGASSVTNQSIGTAAIKDLSSSLPPYTAASAAGPASLQFAEDTDNGTNKITLKAPAALAADADVILPASGTLYGTESGSITSAQLATSLTDETGSGGGFVRANSPTITTPDIVGTATNNDAAAGSVGEFITSSIATGSAVSLTTNTTANVTSISLTAGDWDVEGNIFFKPAATTSVTAALVSISTTSATLAPSGLGQINMRFPAFVPGIGADIGIASGSMRISLASTTTIYLVAYSTFTVSTMGAYGAIGARRVR